MDKNMTCHSLINQECNWICCGINTVGDVIIKLHFRGLRTAWFLACKGIINYFPWTICWFIKYLLILNSLRGVVHTFSLTQGQGTEDFVKDFFGSKQTLLLSEEKENHTFKNVFYFVCLLFKVMESLLMEHRSEKKPTKPGTACLPRG